MRIWDITSTGILIWTMTQVAYTCNLPCWPPVLQRSTFLTATSCPVDFSVALYTCGMVHDQA